MHSQSGEFERFLETNYRCVMAEKSGGVSDETEDEYATQPHENLLQEIKRLEREKQDLENKNRDRQLLEEKVRELRGTVTSLKHGTVPVTLPGSSTRNKSSPKKSPGGGTRGRTKGSKASPGAAAKDNNLAASLAALSSRARKEAARVGVHLDDETDDVDEEKDDYGSDDDSDDGRHKVMTQEHKYRIQQNRDTLVESMISDDIFNDLIKHRILTTADASRIKEKNTCEAINEELLNILIRRSDRAFDVFVDSLRKTLQEHLADLLIRKSRMTSRQQQQHQTRKRTAGELNVSVDVDEVISQAKSPRRFQCSCQEVEEQILDMAKSAYTNIRRRDHTPAGFEQFKKELSQTNEIIKDTMEIMHSVKILCKHGDIKNISSGSVKFTLYIISSEKLRQLWDMYKSGHLLSRLQAGLVTKALLRRFHARRIRLGVRISEGEYIQCLRELEAKTRRLRSHEDIGSELQSHHASSQQTKTCKSLNLPQYMSISDSALLDCENVSASPRRSLDLPSPASAQRRALSEINVTTELHESLKRHSPCHSCETTQTTVKLPSSPLCHPNNNMTSSKCMISQPVLYRKRLRSRMVQDSMQRWWNDS